MNQPKTSHKPSSKSGAHAGGAGTPKCKQPIGWVLASCVLFATATMAADQKPLKPEAVLATQALAAKLSEAGRGEVRFDRSAHDVFSGKWVNHRGILSLEPPDRVMLHFSSTGERLALRADGGEWLQPELEQMLRLEPRHLSVARLWWGFLLSRADTPVHTVQVAPRHYQLVAIVEQGAGDSATVWLNRDGLPTRLEFRDDSGIRVRYQFSDWKFGPARGRKAYVLAAPEGIEVVNLP